MLCVTAGVPQPSWEVEIISKLILQLGKLSLGEDILAWGDTAKNRQSQDLNTGLLTCILPALSMGLTLTLTCPPAQIYSPSAQTSSFLAGLP